MRAKGYLLSVPERLVRSVLGLGAGVAREVGEVALPDGIRHSQLYQNLVDATLRYLIEQVGGVEGVYSTETTLPDDFLARRTAGNVVELLGVVAFRASPVWILAALADLCGLGRQLIPEMADELKAQGLLEKETRFTGVDQMLDGLEVMEKGAYRLLLEHLKDGGDPAALAAWRARIESHLARPQEEKEAEIEPLFRELAQFTAETLCRRGFDPPLAA